MSGGMCSECKEHCEPAAPESPSDGRFTITYRDSVYRVSIPDYDGGNVISVEQYDAQKARADTLEYLNATMHERISGLVAEIAQARELHEMQMAACMTATLQNTEKTIKDRIGRDNPYWTQCYEDVCRSVDREIALRFERDDLAKWKRQYLLVESWWQQVDAAVRKRKDIRLGESVSAKALDLIEERDKYAAVAAQAMAVAEKFRAEMKPEQGTP